MNEELHDWVPLPSGWRYLPLSELVDNTRGISYGVVQPGNDVEDGIPIVRVNNMTSNRLDMSSCMRVSQEIEAKYHRTRLKGGEVLLSLVGTLGLVAIVPPAFRGWNTARAVGVIPLKPEVDSRWISICLRSQQAQRMMRVWATTTVQATLNLRDVSQLPIPMPPSSQIGEIVSQISVLEDKIELNRKMNETLEQTARAIFKSWFIDFDPVHAKAAGKKPFGMDDAIAALFPSSFEKSELGEIPKGWSHGLISDLFAANVWTLSKGDRLGCIDYIEISSVSSGQVNEIATYPPGAEPSRARRRLKHFDTVLSTVRPDRAAYFLAYRPTETLIASTGFAVLTAKNINDSLFGHVCVTMKEFFDELGRLADGGAYPAIRPEVILSRPSVIPARSLREEYHRMIEPMVKLMKENQHESLTLGRCRDLLLPRLLSGEVSLKGTS